MDGRYQSATTLTGTLCLIRCKASTMTRYNENSLVLIGRREYLTNGRTHLTNSWESPEFLISHTDSHI